MADHVTETFDLEAEHERLTDAIADVSEKQAEMDPSTEQYATLEQRAGRLDTHRRGVEYALEAWDVDAITLRALTLGDDARLDEHTNSAAERRLWQIGRAHV